MCKSIGHDTVQDTGSRLCAETLPLALDSAAMSRTAVPALRELSPLPADEIPTPTVQPHLMGRTCSLEPGSHLSLLQSTKLLSQTGSHSTGCTDSWQKDPYWDPAGEGQEQMKSLRTTNQYYDPSAHTSCF